MNPILWMVVLFGLVGPFLTFGVGFGLWINLLVGLFSTYMGEKNVAMLKNEKSGSILIDPNEKDAFSA